MELPRKGFLGILFFLLLPALLNAQSKEFDELIGRERKLGSITNDSLLSNEYLTLALKYRFIDSVKSNDYWKKYLKHAVSRKDSLALGQFYYYKSMDLYYGKDYLKAIENARMCMKFTKDRDDFFFLEVTQIPLRSFHYLNRLEEAEKTGLEIIRMNKFENMPLQLAKIYFNLGLITVNMLKDSSVYYFYKATYYSKKEPDNRVLLPCYHHISCYYRDRNKLDSAVKYASLAFNLSKDTAHYNNVDFISPANNYQELLSRIGRHKEAQEISRELQMRQYDLKISSITYPEISRQIGYLEYLGYNQRTRFIILLIISFSIFVVLSFFIFFNRKMKKKQTELAESLDLNQVLMRETNHRVKNNFQMMMSMLSVNAGYSTDSIGLFVEQTRARIASMARVHEMFLQNPAGTTADTYSFFNEVIQSLENSLSLKEKNISIHFESKCDSLKSEKMVTLGLIINELVVNSVKYAFSGDKPGKIELSLDKKDEYYVLHFSDNGPGIDQSEGRVSSSGMSIVFSLAKQLKGEARILKKEGTVVEINFKP